VSENIAELTGHEGVIFRIVFNGDFSMLASVSDDRTVRVWDMKSGSQLFAGWGHICRLWDVSFYGQHEIITTGEDGVMKIWNFETKLAVSTLRGHIGSCLRLRVLPCPGRASFTPNLPQLNPSSNSR
jgi:WD40 repeat protein